MLRDSRTPRGRDLGPLDPYPAGVPESLTVVPVGEWQRPAKTYTRCGLGGCEVRKGACLIHNGVAAMTGQPVKTGATRRVVA